MGRPRPADGQAGRLGAEQRRYLAEAGAGQAFGLGCYWSSALSASSLAKSSVAFPWISKALRCRSSWSSRRAILR